MGLVLAAALTDLINYVPPGALRLSILDVFFFLGQFALQAFVMPLATAVTGGTALFRVPHLSFSIRAATNTSAASISTSGMRLLLVGCTCLGNAFLPSNRKGWAGVSGPNADQFNFF